tara:strand:- start:201 stop:365 length:165 start_codon:yes stop_codon:yes gene_type:complete
MRGKTVKLLRKAGVADKAGKRHYKSLDAKSRAIFTDFLRTSLSGKGIELDGQGK